MSLRCLSGVGFSLRRPSGPLSRVVPRRKRRPEVRRRLKPTPLCFRLVLLLLPWSLAAAGPRVLRVCADPNNLPFSNDRGEGFENRLAELIARDLGAKLEYTWWSQHRSFIRRSLGEDRCDALMGVPAALDSVAEPSPVGVGSTD